MNPELFFKKKDTGFHFSVTGSMSSSHAYHSSTLLLNGTVLVLGGSDYSASASGELYNPATGTFSATGNTSKYAYDNTATKLTDGRIVVTYNNQAELYDQSSGSFSITGNLTKSYTNHSAILLPNGKVLVADSSRLEVYDPDVGSWKEAGLR